MRQELPEEMDAQPVIVAPLVPPMYQICAAPVDGFCHARSGTPSPVKLPGSTPWRVAAGADFNKDHIPDVA